MPDLENTSRSAFSKSPVPPISLYRVLGYPLVKPLLTILLRPNVVGRGRIPRRGGCILVANHESPIDPFVLGLSCHRAIRFLAKSELYESRVMRTLLRAFGTIPVDRDRGDQNALARARQLIERGAVVGVFPQGTCLPYRDRPFRRGAARLALETGAPIVPVALVNTEQVVDPRTFRVRPARVRILIGEPIRVERKRATSEAAGRLTELLEATIRDLRGPHGEPAHSWLD